MLVHLFTRFVINVIFLQACALHMLSGRNSVVSTGSLLWIFRQWQLVSSEQVIRLENGKQWLKKSPDTSSNVMLCKNKKLELMLTRRAKPLAVSVRKLPVYLQPFRRSSFLECALQPKIAKSIKKPLFWKFTISITVQKNSYYVCTNIPKWGLPRHVLPDTQLVITFWNLPRVVIRQWNSQRWALD